MDTEAARAKITEWKQCADERALQTQQAAERLKELRVTVCDENQTVEVTIDSGGALVDVQFSARIQRQAPEFTRRTMLDVYQTAKDQLAEQAREIVTETMGPTSASAKAMMATFVEGKGDRQ
ncbi:YbaB/EbfC family nucleoid-associated protein [Glycomyces luteolus]|uniref:YbaB/EbfC family nucleoid-associated protein n=1 Tax=Glycomyces luteolus TaxID=2670330 RepID=A0A9X3PGM8_9ACTN|nr:YbaB/EbfC family nucleoid-associated protein [Glycomyces luteolus]MDA1363105.1 YbaB/EbfC family nucleoid-associated protein [Glycomyces luteolus]